MRAAGGELPRWLADSIGSQPLRDPSLFEAIAKIDAPIATTNYDTLGEEALSCGSRSWSDSVDVAAWFAQDRRNRPIFHLHGVWADPETAVFGHTSYQSLANHEHAQFVQQVLAATKSFLFIGCGSGMEDPNLGILIDWIRTRYPNSLHRHYRLCLDKDVWPLRMMGNFQKYFQRQTVGKKDEILSKWSAFSLKQMSHSRLCKTLEERD
jgi:SIR2-like protein